VIQRYFTCEGHFNMVYQYHIRLLMHFTGKKALNIPFYLYRSLGKWLTKCKKSISKLNTTFFILDLIKLLVIEEFRKTNRESRVPFVSTMFNAEINRYSIVQKDTPPSGEKTVQTTFGSSRRKREKGKEPLEHSMKTIEDVEETLGSKRSKVKGKKSYFHPETTKIEKPKRSLTRSEEKNLAPTDEGMAEELVHHAAEETVEAQPPSGKKVKFSQEVLEKEKPNMDL
jgi:hypothetical protein